MEPVHVLHDDGHFRRGRAFRREGLRFRRDSLSFLARKRFVLQKEETRVEINCLSAVPWLFFCSYYLSLDIYRIGVVMLQGDFFVDKVDVWKSHYMGGYLWKWYWVWDFSDNKFITVRLQYWCKYSYIESLVEMDIWINWLSWQDWINIFRHINWQLEVFFWKRKRGCRFIILMKKKARDNMELWQPLNPIHDFI